MNNSSQNNNLNNNCNNYNYSVFGQSSVTIMNPTNQINDGCINEMRRRGFKDNVFNGWKLEIYNGNVSLACRYYYYDEWCHQHCVFGHCKNENKCKGNHRYNLTHLIENKKFEQAKLLCQYLLYFYTNRCIQQNVSKKRAWIAQLHWKLAQVYGKNGFSNYYDYKMAQSHYQQAIQHHWQQGKVRVDYAVFLQQKMHNPQEAEKQLMIAVSLHNNGVTNLQMGKFLSRERRYSDAIRYFSKTLKLNNETNNIYCHCNCVCHYEYGFALYKISDYEESYKMYIKALDIDKHIHNGTSRYAPKGTFKIFDKVSKIIQNQENKRINNNNNNNNSNNNNCTTKQKKSKKAPKSQCDRLDNIENNRKSDFGYNRHPIQITNRINSNEYLYNDSNNNNKVSSNTINKNSNNNDNNDDDEIVATNFYLFDRNTSSDNVSDDSRYFEQFLGSDIWGDKCSDDTIDDEKFDINLNVPTPPPPPKEMNQDRSSLINGCDASTQENENGSDESIVDGGGGALELQDKMDGCGNGGVKDIIEENNNDNNDNKDELSQEFLLFWESLPYFEPTKSNYYSKFVQNDWNCIAMITLFTHDILINDIGMNTIHAKLFENYVSQISQENKQFLQWLNSFEFACKYSRVFAKWGVYSFESFYRRFKNIESLINTLKLSTNINIIDNDCNEMWQNTPQYKRLSKKRQSLNLIA